MKPVCVLGNGQLGRMLRQAGELLGISVYTIGPSTNTESLPIQQSVITTEIELVLPEIATKCDLIHHSAFVNRDIFPLLTDRLKQKQLLDKLNLANAPWQLLSLNGEYSQIFSRLGKLAIVKRRIGGYNGYGQWKLRTEEIGTIPKEYSDTYIIEQQINFSNEISLIGARGYNGTIVFYPITYNLHKEGILCTSVALPQPDSKLQQQAELMLSTILNKLNYIGVMTMECFVTVDGLLINELAPRVHNSGHWTQNGASISQFEMHLRAILNLPMPSPVVNAPSVMINLIGTNINTQWLSEPLVHLHWYDKKIYPSRKVGHLNLSDPNNQRIINALVALTPMLPPVYTNCITWVQTMLCQQF